MSSPSLSPSSSHSNEDSSDTSSSEFTSTVLKKYDANINDNKDFKTVIISHGVEDILSDGTNYVSNVPYQGSKGELPSVVPQAFAQDYNSRDSTSFSIHDILGLQQSYNPAQVEVLETTYDYNGLNYERVSNSSNNYGSGAEEAANEDSTASVSIFAGTPQVINQVVYNRSYANDLVRYNQRSGLDQTKEINDIHESSFSGQVWYCN